MMSSRLFACTERERDKKRKKTRGMDEYIILTLSVLKGARASDVIIKRFRSFDF